MPPRKNTKKTNGVNPENVPAMGEPTPARRTLRTKNTVNYYEEKVINTEDPVSDKKAKTTEESSKSNSKKTKTTKFKGTSNEPIEAKVTESKAIKEKVDGVSKKSTTKGKSTEKDANKKETKERENTEGVSTQKAPKRREKFTEDTVSKKSKKDTSPISTSSKSDEKEVPKKTSRRKRSPSPKRTQSPKPTPSKVSKRNESPIRVSLKSEEKKVVKKTSRKKLDVSPGHKKSSKSTTSKESKRSLSPISISSKSEEKAVVTKTLKKNLKVSKRDTSPISISSESEEKSNVIKTSRKRRSVSPNNVKDSKTGDAKKLKNTTDTDWDSIDYSCHRLNEENREANFKIASWNVDGIRAWHNKGCFKYIEHEKPDILCIQETKSSYDKLPDDIKSFKGYHQYWCSASKEGYSGVGLFTKKMPLNVINGINDEEHDAEGRIITAEFEYFFVISVYVPNSGRGLVTLPKRLDWNTKFLNFCNDLKKKKPIIICGDMNVAHLEIDLKNPKTNKKNAGFTQEERDGMTEFLANGYVDTFRKLYPTRKDAYTFWTYMLNSRAKNTGWRLDYFLISEKLESKLCDNVMRSSIYGSDHCPIVLYMSI